MADYRSDNGPVTIRGQSQLYRCLEVLQFGFDGGGDLAALAKPAARAHGTAWHAAGGDDRTWEDDEGSGRLVRLVRPPNDDGGTWTNLLDLITTEIGQIKQARLRDRVDELFRNLVASAVLRFDEPMPSQADLSRRLGMPTSTIAESYGRLRKIVEKCRPGATSS